MAENGFLLLVFENIIILLQKETEWHSSFFDENKTEEWRCSFLFLMVVWKNFLPLIHSSVEVLQSTLHLSTFQGFGETAQTLVRVASVEHEVKGAVGAVGGVLREIPPAAIRPIIIASQATTNVLDGVRSQLVPDARTEAALKWRSDYFWRGCLFGGVDVSGVIVSFID